tara:strand:+ start:499 stop:1299 length:801 start_codon:yes stop_codon:yes gene_type:complete
MKIVSSKFNFLKPLFCPDLVRLGNRNDGGYVLPKELVESSDGLLSFGYGYDCSFEDDYIKKTNKSVIIYDHTCDYFKLIKVLFKYLRRFLLFRKRISDVKTHLNNLIKHHNFVTSKKVKFNKKKIVKNKIENKTEIEINSVIKNLKFKEAIFKCDIEGTEYNILEDIINSSKIFSCILIEFHEIKENLNKFIYSINKLTEVYHIVHLHGNNHDPIIEEINIPNTLEVTLVKKDFIKEKKFVYKFPIKNLDEPNNPNLSDHEFEFKN